jgi:myo-inositol 2-dehydrogenase/D-chiro-inositol 1-dehydrogenase
MAFPDAVITAVTDVTPTAASQLAALTGATAVPDLDALLELAPDAVYVCVPPYAHGALERRILEAGSALFVEKPLAADLPAAEEIAQAVRDRGAVTATGYHWRYLEGVERARELLAQTPARLALASWLDRVPPPAWWARRELSGGQTVEQVTHVLDVLVHLLGGVEEVYAAGVRAADARPHGDVDAAAGGVLRFASGAVATVASTSLLDARHRAGVELVCAGRRIELSETEFTVADAGGARTSADRGRA